MADNTIANAIKFLKGEEKSLPATKTEGQVYFAYKNVGTAEKPSYTGAIYIDTPIGGTQNRIKMTVNADIADKAFNDSAGLSIRETYLSSLGYTDDGKQTILIKGSGNNQTRIALPIASTTKSGIVTTDAQSFGGAKTFNTINSTNLTVTGSNGFNYSSIGAGAADVARPVWFADNSGYGKPVVNTNFTYNPATQTLSVANLSGTADKATKDSAGNDIRNTYISDVTISGRTITVTKGSGAKVTLTTQDTDTWRGIQNNLTSDSTTDSLSAAQGKYLKSLIDGKSNNGHNHDDRYYTETEINNKLANYLPLSGGTMTRSLNFANGTWNAVGDDVAIGDINISGTLGIIGYNGNTSIKLVQYDASTTSGNATPGVAWTCTGNGTSTISGTLSGTFSGNLSGTATAADYPTGFNSRVTSAAWGNQTGTLITDWHTYNGGDIQFRDNNGQLNVITDGFFYQNEGQNLVLDSVNYSNYAAPKSHTHSKSQITDFPTSMPASDVYAWAKASSKPSYSWDEITNKPSSFNPSSHTHPYLPLSGGTMTGTINFTVNQLACNFRPDASGYCTGIMHQTSGDEALMFAAANAVTSFIFKCGQNPVGMTSTTWTGITPSMQIKKQSVYINSLIANNVPPSYNLYVNGTTRCNGTLGVGNGSSAEIDFFPNSSSTIGAKIVAYNDRIEFVFG